MSLKNVGVVIMGTDSNAILAGIERAEELGIPAAWVPEGIGLDPLTLFAGAAGRTQRILLGSAIITTFARHPVSLVRQVQVIDHLAPGRLRLGVGPGHRDSQVSTYGADFYAPLGHLGEYLHILKSLLHDGSVDFDGRYYRAQARISQPVNVPVMASALQRKSFELCGAEADGAISWMCPGAYLRDVGLPAMKAGAERANRPVPPLVAHAPVCVHDNPDEVKDAMQHQSGYLQLPFYQRMFATAGFPEAFDGRWSSGMIDATVLSGNESQVAEKLEGLLATGVTEVMALPIPAGSNREASIERTLRLLGSVAA